MQNSRDIIEAAGGRDAVADLVGVNPRHVANCAQDELLPAAWFDALERKIGRDLDRARFTFKGADRAGAA